MIGALAPVALLSVAFPEGGSEPFTWATLSPIPAIALVALVLIPKRHVALLAGIALYALGCIAAFEIATPVGSNAARLGPLLAGPIVALVWYPRHKKWLAVVALPLLYFQWQAPIRDVRTSAGDPSVKISYYQPLLKFLEAQHGPPFRVEIPFTRFHWEAYEVAPRFPLARGWERQLDIKYNSLFYNGTLTAATYETWLHTMAVRYVAVSDADLDYSAHEETALIDRGLPYLRLVFHSAHWHVYAVDHPTPIAQGAATLQQARAELADTARSPAGHREAARALHALLGALGRAGLRDRQRRVHGAAGASSRGRSSSSRSSPWGESERPLRAVIEGCAETTVAPVGTIRLSCVIDSARSAHGHCRVVGRMFSGSSCCSSAPTCCISSSVV